MTRMSIHWGKTYDDDGLPYHILTCSLCGSLCEYQGSWSVESEPEYRALVCNRCREERGGRHEDRIRGVLRA